MKFYKCNVCKNLIHYIKEEHVPVMCCGDVMKRVIPNTTEGAYEKHIPVITENGNVVVVDIGSVPHPMLEEHYIEWICLETDKGYHVKHLNPGDLPKAQFTLENNEKIVSAYEQCNIHGLWEK